jgi:hypothetical protein
MGTATRRRQLRDAQTRRRDNLRTTLKDKNFKNLESTKKWFRDKKFPFLANKKIHGVLISALADEVPSHSIDRKAWTYNKAHEMHDLLGKGLETQAVQSALALRDTMAQRGVSSPRIEGIVLEVLRDVGQPLDVLSLAQAFRFQEQKCLSVIDHWRTHGDPLHLGAALMSLGDLYRSNLIPEIGKTVQQAVELMEAAQRVLQLVRSDRRARILLYQASAWKARLIGLDQGELHAGERCFLTVERLVDEIEIPRLAMEAQLVSTGFLVRKGQRRGGTRFLDRAERILDELDKSYSELSKVSPYAKLGLWFRQLDIRRAQKEKNLEETAEFRQIVRQWQQSPCVYRGRSIAKWTNELITPERTPFIGIPMMFVCDEFEDWID